MTSKLQKENACLKHPLSLKRRDKNRLFKFTSQGGKTWALCWEVANFLERNVWGMTKEWIRVVLQIGSLNITDEGEKIDWRGLDIIWENNCFLRLSDKGGDYNFKKKQKNKPNRINEVASLFFNTRGRQGLHFHPASCIPNKDFGLCNLTLLMFLRWLRGLLHLFCLTLISSL